MTRILPFALVLAFSATGAVAQSTTQDANLAEARQVAGPTPSEIANAENQARYQEDMARYEQALHSSRREARRDQAHYQHQLAAYHAAMSAWREQVYACNHGNNRACNAPSPNPADFY